MYYLEVFVMLYRFDMINRINMYKCMTVLSMLAES